MQAETSMLRINDAMRSLSVMRIRLGQLLRRAHGGDDGPKIASILGEAAVIEAVLKEEWDTAADNAAAIREEIMANGNREEQQ